ncbi:MAG TPA: TonB-dependent receptor [Caulobacter sp.]|nr:TonB-dependent receptor [Caulobacter sp.]
MPITDTIRRRHGVLLAAASVLSLSAAAKAQAADRPGADDGAKVEEVIVTAQKRSETLQKTPVSVTAYAKETIEQQKISTFRDLSGRVPGLLAPKRSTAYTTQQYSIRGIGEIDTYPEPSVAVYVDDVYLARTVGSLYDTPDLERVEVLRGPQGTLYGRNSSAGAIRFITKEPTAERTGEIGLTYGSYDNLDFKARFNGAILSDDRLNGSLSVIRHTRDGWQHSVPLNLDVNDLDLTVVRAKLGSRLTDKLTATFSADAMWDRSSQSYYTPVNQPNGVPGGGKTDPDLTWSDTLPYNKTTVYGGSLTFKYALSDHLTLKSVTAVRGMHGPIYYDNDGVTQIKGDSYAGFDQHYRTQEFNLNGEYDRLNFVAGLYYFYEYFHNHRLSQSAGSPNDDVGTVTHTNNYLRTESWAAFGQVNYKVTDRLSATLGGRYTEDRRRFDNYGQQKSATALHDPQEWNYDPWQFGRLYGPYTTNFDVHAPWTTFSSFTPKVGLQFQATPDILTYGSFSKGFKSGGYDLRTNTVVGSQTPYRPQVTTTYELGIKTRWLDGAVTANLAAFYNDIKDFQVRATATAALGNVVNQLINAGEAHSKGAELEIAAAPIEGLRINATAAYLETAYDTFTAALPNNVAGRKTLVGLDFPYAPKWQLGLAVNYRLPLDTPGAWRIGADAQYEARRYVDIYNTAQTQVKPQAFVNATVNYASEGDRWAAGVQVKNLFDLRRGQAGGYSPSNAGAQPLYYRAYNEPRMINLFVNRKF